MTGSDVGGLLHDDRPNLLHVSPGQNLSWPNEDKNLTYIPPGELFN